MDILAIISLIATIVTIVGFLPQFGSWYEARQQRLLSQPENSPKSPKVKYRSKLSPGETWRCGIYDYPPLSEMNGPHGGVPRGLFIEIVSRVALKLEIKPELFLFTYEDFYSGGEIPDLVIGMFDTPRRRKFMSFSRPIYEIGLQGISRLRQRGDVLEGLREGTLKAAVYHGEVGWEFALDELPDVQKQHHLAVLNGGRQMDTMTFLRDGIYDVVLMDALSCRNFLNEGNNKKRFRLSFDSPLSMYKCGIAVHHRHEYLIKLINEALEEIRNSPDYLEMEASALKGYEAIIKRRGLRATAAISLSSRAEGAK